MLSPVDGKPKAIYLLYGDKIGRRASHPEYMMPMSLMRVIHKDSSHISMIDDILKNMMIKQDPQKSKQDLRLTSFSNFLEGKFVLETRNQRLSIVTTNAENFCNSTCLEKKNYMSSWNLN